MEKIFRHFYNYIFLINDSKNVNLHFILWFKINRFQKKHIISNQVQLKREKFPKISDKRGRTRNKTNYPGRNEIISENKLTYLIS